MNLSPVEVGTPADTAVSNSQAPARLEHRSTARARRGRSIVATFVLVAIALALGAGLWFISRRLAPQITAPGSANSAYVASFPEKSVAVLPFEFLPNDPAAASVAEAVQDDLMTALSKVADLRVISATSVHSYTAGKPRDLRKIAQSLGAGHIVEGNVQLDGGRVRVTARLTDARWAARLWNFSYERKADEVLGRQGELVQRVALQLQANVTDTEKAALAERVTYDVSAYALYVHGKQLLTSVTNGDINQKLTQAVEVLDQAIARDPQFYLAYCQLAAAHSYIYFFGFDHTPARLALIEKALAAASRLHPEGGETRLAKANYYYRCFFDYEKARAELAQTQRILPNNSEVFELMGYIDRRQGLWTESARSLQRALELDPRNAFLLQQIASSYQEFRQFRAMAAALDRSLTLEPNDLGARVTRAYVDLEWRGDIGPLRQTVHALLAEKPDAITDLADQWFYLSLCQRDPAEMARALAAMPASGNSMDLNFPRSYCEALVARQSGDAAAAQTKFVIARAEVEKMVQAQPDYGPGFVVLGLIDAGLGRKEDAIREGRRAKELLPVSRNAIDGAEVMKYMAAIYTWCGEKDLALAELAATLKIPSTVSYGYLKHHPYWDALRGDERFEKIVAGLAPKA